MQFFDHGPIHIHVNQGGHARVRYTATEHSALPILEILPATEDHPTFYTLRFDHESDVQLIVTISNDQAESIIGQLTTLFAERSDANG